MKNKSRVPKRPAVHQDVPPTNPPLTTDELIYFLQQSHEKTVHLAGEMVGKLLPTLLFLRKAIDLDHELGDLTVLAKDGETVYCNADSAVADILGLFSARFYQSWQDLDGRDFKTNAAVKRWMETHPHRASH